MSWHIPIIEKVRWIYLPHSSSTHPLNNINENEFKEINETTQSHQTHKSNINTFSKVYAQRHVNLKFEYEQKIIALEKIINDNNKRQDAN